MSSSPLGAPGIVIPTFREAENIASLIAALRGLVPDAAIIVVDDSPDDATAAAIDAMAAPGTQVVRRATKAGRGSAVLAGMRLLLAQDVDPIVEMDADHSHPPSELPALLAHLQQERLDLLIASRYLERSRIENWPLTRRAFSRAANAVARSALGVPVHDYTNGYRIYSRRAAHLVAEQCGKAGSGFIALSEILVTLHYHGFRIGELPTVFVNRTRGQSSLNAREVLSAAVGLWDTIQLRRRLQHAAGHDRLS